nr:MAG TPA: hypothetical protein [Crassvirales sp.]
MINLFKIEEVDFMGYSINKSTLSYHHLIVPRRLGGPETIDNGAILNRLTSHPYLHIIENRDPEIFFLVTSEMVDENIKRKIDLENLRKINDLLNTFEREFCSSLTRKGKPLIKEEYTKRLIK